MHVHSVINPRPPSNIPTLSRTGLIRASRQCRSAQPEPLYTSRTPRHRARSRTVHPAAARGTLNGCKIDTHQSLFAMRRRTLHCQTAAGSDCAVVLGAGMPKGLQDGVRKVLAESLHIVDSTHHKCCVCDPKAPSKGGRAPRRTIFAAEDKPRPPYSP